MWDFNLFTLLLIQDDKKNTKQVNNFLYNFGFLLVCTKHTKKLEMEVEKSVEVIQEATWEIRFPKKKKERKQLLEERKKEVRNLIVKKGKFEIKIANK